eukprot:471546-Prymnesium_polylepis.1
MIGCSGVRMLTDARTGRRLQPSRGSEPSHALGYLLLYSVLEAEARDAIVGAELCMCWRAST